MWVTVRAAMDQKSKTSGAITNPAHHASAPDSSDATSPHDHKKSPSRCDLFQYFRYFRANQSIHGRKGTGFGH